MEVEACTIRAFRKTEVFRGFHDGRCKVNNFTATVYCVLDYFKGISTFCTPYAYGATIYGSKYTVSVVPSNVKT